MTCTQLQLQAVCFKESCEQHISNIECRNQDILFPISCHFGSVSLFLQVIFSTTKRNPNPNLRGASSDTCRRSVVKMMCVRKSEISPAMFGSGCRTISRNTAMIVQFQRELSCGPIKALMNKLHWATALATTTLYNFLKLSCLDHSCSFQILRL